MVFLGERVKPRPPGGEENTGVAAGASGGYALNTGRTEACNKKGRSVSRAAKSREETPKEGSASLHNLWSKKARHACTCRA